MADVVVDASTAAKWQLVDEQHVERAELLLRDIESQKVVLVVPEFWSFEIASILSKAVANGRISEHAGLEGLHDLLSLNRVVVPFPDPEAAFTAARRFNPTTASISPSRKTAAVTSGPTIANSPARCLRTTLLSAGSATTRIPPRLYLPKRIACEPYT